MTLRRRNVIANWRSASTSVSLIQNNVNWSFHYFLVKWKEKPKRAVKVKRANNENFVPMKG
jgi:hypothetical protein